MGIVGALVGSGEPETVRRDSHLRYLSIGRSWQVVNFVRDQQPELIAILVDVAICAVIGRHGNRSDLVGAATKHADRLPGPVSASVWQLVTEGVGEGGVPLVHQINRRRDYESPDTSIRDGLDAEKRLPAPSREYDAATTVIGPPCIECCLLVLAWLDLERRL